MENDAILFKNLLEKVNIDNIKNTDCCNINLTDFIYDVRNNKVRFDISDNIVDVCNNLVDVSNNIVDVCDNNLVFDVDVSNNIVDVSDNLIDVCDDNLVFDVDVSNNLVDVSDDNLVFDVDVSNNLVDVSDNIVVEKVVKMNKKKRGRPTNKSTKPKITKTKTIKSK